MIHTGTLSTSSPLAALNMESFLRAGNPSGLSSSFDAILLSLTQYSPDIVMTLHVGRGRGLAGTWRETL